jgi:hypothetical protein
MTKIILLALILSACGGVAIEGAPAPEPVEAGIPCGPGPVGQDRFCCPTYACPDGESCEVNTATGEMSCRTITP